MTNPRKLEMPEGLGPEQVLLLLADYAELLPDGTAAPDVDWKRVAVLHRALTNLNPATLRQQAAQLAQAQAEQQAALEHIASLARHKKREADQLHADGSGYTTRYEELMAEYEALKRPSEIALRVLTPTTPEPDAPGGED